MSKATTKPDVTSDVEVLWCTGAGTSAGENVWNIGRNSRPAVSVVFDSFTHDFSLITLKTDSITKPMAKSMQNPHLEMALMQSWARVYVNAWDRKWKFTCT